MVARQGIGLAVFLIKSHFGDLVSKVCECLLNRGSLSFQELARFVELDPDDSSRNNLLVKNCLLVLIQHNCVQAFSVPKLVGVGGAAKSLTKYFALMDNIFHRLRFGKFSVIVRGDLGPECETLVEGLLQHGRLTFDQLLQRAASKQTEAKRDIIRTYFNKLIHAQYVERCPRADPFITPDETASAGRHRSKSTEAQPSIEQQAMAAAVLSDTERFSGIFDSERHTTVDEKKAKDYNPGVSVGDKRRHEALESDNDVEAAITENEVLWRANFEKFVHCLKKKACVENIRSKFGLDAGIVLEAMIESNCKLKDKEKNSVIASMDAIIEGVRAKPGGSTMTLEQVRIILEQVGCQLNTEETGASYTIDLMQIIRNCQVDEVEALILKRYGNEAYRIYRFLVKERRYTETDQIGGKTFVEKNEAQRILYKLWRDDYLDMEKVVITAGQQLSYYLWKVKEQLGEHILNDMYHATLNLCQRATHMVEQDPEILLPNKGLPDELRKEKLAQQKRWMILQSSLAKLDEALMLFRDFCEKLPTFFVASDQ